MTNGPADPSAIPEMFRRAVTFHGAGRLAEAESAYREILQIAPQHPDVLHALGIVAYQTQNYDAAEHLIGQAIALRPGFAEALNNRGNALMQLKRQSEALASFDQAVQAAPQRADFLSNRSVALLELQRFEEALASSDLALQLIPDDPIAHYNRGNALLELMRLEDAVASYERALARQPKNVDAWCNRGIALQHLQRLDDALTSFDRALVLQPDHAKAHWNRSVCFLLTGDFAKGWEEFEWRHRLALPASSPRKFFQPAWDGRDLEPGKLLVWGEQGVGDEVLYASMISDLLELGREVVVEADARLVPLFARSFPKATVAARRLPPDPATMVPEITAQVAAGDLGRWLRPDLANFPKGGSYLVAEPARVASFRTMLGDGPKVGLSWISKNPTIGLHKSTVLSDWAPILQTLGVRFVDLQYGDTAAERTEVKTKLGVEVNHLPNLDLRDDIEGLAALVSACDLIITVSNTNAHLAGALGRPAWVLVPTGTGQLWYWGADRSASPWYPSVITFRQKTPGNWSDVIRDIAGELADSQSRPKP